MDIRYPRPLRPGDRIGVTSPSAGVGLSRRPRLEVAVRSLRDRGYDVVVGDCMSGESVTSAPRAQRAAELTSMLCDPSIRAVVPPWGGELAIDLVDLLDWDALAAAEPTWTVGYSDSTTWMLPLTLRLGWATLHGTNLMDTPYLPPAGIRHWTEVVTATEPFTQAGAGRFATGYDDWVADPGISTLTLDGTGSWTVLGGGGVDVTGRLIGGCVETVVSLAGSPFGDVAGFGREHAEDGLVVFLDIAEWGAYDVCRALHGLRLAGWFDEATAILVSRVSAPDSEHLTQREAVADALGMLDIPIVLDVDCGHVAPYLPLVTGARARVVVDGVRQEITQSLD